jgi:hypothetical protein
MSRFKRGSALVNWPVQGALIGRTVLHWAFFLIALGGLVFLLHFISNLMTGEQGWSAASILQEIWDRHQLVVVALASLVPFFCLDLILWSHRFAGPMIRLRRSMHDLAEGKSVAPVRLRSRDYWKYLADDFNLLLVRIEKAEKRAADFQAALLENVAQPVTPPARAPLSTASLEACESQPNC